eukprot:516593-Rhodomonas_salina.2
MLGPDAASQMTIIVPLMGKPRNLNRPKDEALSKATLLRIGYTLSGADRGYAATHSPCNARCSHELAGHVQDQTDGLAHKVLQESEEVVSPPIVVRARYAMPGTSIGYAARHSLCDVRAMVSGTHRLR